MREQRLCRSCDTYKFVDAGVEFEYDGRKKWMCGACVDKTLHGKKKRRAKPTMTDKKVERFLDYIHHKDTQP